MFAINDISLNNSHYFLQAEGFHCDFIIHKNKTKIKQKYK